MEELQRLANQYQLADSDLSMAMAIYMLGFSTYKGFSAHNPSES